VVAFVFVAVMLQTAGLFLLVDSLASYAWMRTDPLVYAFLRGIGLLMVGLGAWWSLVERRGPRVVAYALLVGFGISMLALGTGTPAGVQIALGMAGARALSAAVWAAGAATVFASGPGDTGERTAIRRIPAAAAGIGALSLVGFPLTAGFAGLWMTLATAEGWNAALVAILLGTAATWLAVARWGWGLLNHPTSQDHDLGRGRMIFLLAGCAAVILLGVVPGLLLGWAAPAIGAFVIG
jgi:formate hydrogenlyase subunit 3/multisubunit Na+/H+ antiporter MnhD subunit